MNVTNVVHMHSMHIGNLLEHVLRAIAIYCIAGNF